MKKLKDTQFLPFRVCLLQLFKMIFNALVILPAVLIMAGLCSYAYIVSMQKGLGKTSMEKFSGTGFLSAARSAFFPFLIIAILFAGIYRVHLPSPRHRWSPVSWLSY